MRVYQIPFNVADLLDQKKADFIINTMASVSPPLVENRQRYYPLLTDFTGSKGLALYAKNMTTLIDGLASCTGNLFDKPMSGQVFVWATRVGDSSKHKSTTFAGLRGGMQQLSNNTVKSGLVSTISKLEWLTNRLSGSDQKKILTNKLIHSLDFDQYLKRDGGGVSKGIDGQRQTNMAEGHATALIIPASFRHNFSMEIISPIDNRAVTLASIAKLVRTMRTKLDKPGPSRDGGIYS